VQRGGAVSSQRGLDHLLLQRHLLT
jgi:hypothetical protein